MVISYGNGNLNIEKNDQFLYKIVSKVSNKGIIKFTLISSDLTFYVRKCGSVKSNLKY